MSRPRLEVAEVARRYGPEFLESLGHSLSAEQKRVLRDLVLCRTAALGGHVEACDACGHRRICYNSCRNRDCPKCQGAARARWLCARAAELLPVPYFHVVFTLPSSLGPLALQNPQVLYGLLFRAASQTLLEIAADPRHLGARLGFLAILHTWGQNLMPHPHLHCLVPAGGISGDGSRWIGCRKNFLLPVRVLSRVFRGKFLAGLRSAFRHGQLSFHGQLAPWAHSAHFQRLLQVARRRDWVVYAQPPFGGPRPVLKYLARYTHRVAISNQRLIDLEHGQVRFTYKDYAAGARLKIMSLAAGEFLRRFLLHVLPRGWVRIRHYGFLANRVRTQRLALCRRLLGLAPTPAASSPLPASPPVPSLPAAPGAPEPRCPRCGQGQMLVIEILPALPSTRPAGPPTLARAPPRPLGLAARVQQGD